MARTRDLEAELRDLQRGLTRIFRRTLPSKQFRAEMILGTISLELTLRKLSRTQDLEKRRKLKAKFDHGLFVVHQGLYILWQSRWGDQDVKAEIGDQGDDLGSQAAASPSF